MKRRGKVFYSLNFPDLRQTQWTPDGIILPCRGILCIFTVCTVSLSNSRAKGARHSGCFKETNISDMERERGYMRSNIRSFLGPEYYLITIKKI